MVELKINKRNALKCICLVADEGGI